MHIRTSALLAFTGWLVIGGAPLGAEEMTLTGIVGDTACGVTHSSGRLLAIRGPDPAPDDARKCTLACVGHVGIAADFALIVEDAVYTLKTSDEDVRMELEKLAGNMATVTGESYHSSVTGETITVESVMMVE